MTIVSLLEGLETEWESGPLDGEIKGIAYDSRLVQEGYLFVAVKGFHVDGHDYIQDAVNRGATMIVAEHPLSRTASGQAGFEREVAAVGVLDSRKALALTAAAFYGHPSQRLSLIGITGTNGKTTTSFIMKSILDRAGRGAGLLGTICYMTGDKTSTASNTTPESLDLQRYLSDMVMNNMEHAVLEVSSHALALKRVEGCSFRVVAFTNFSQDHLDFHHTMDEYFNVKSGLVHYLSSRGSAVLNYDDKKIRGLTDKLDCNVVTFGLGPGAMIRAENIRGSGVTGDYSGGLAFDVQTPESTFSVESKIIGRFNVYNILASIGIAYALGIKNEVIQQGVKEAEPVAGRFENLDAGQNFLCIIDYAHTEDALRKLLEEARRITPGRIVTVFGCGGDRDRSKRPLMGAAASALSDFVIVTSDNPRSEDPDGIIRDIVEGITKRNYISHPEREEAIREAIGMAHEGDAIVIAGKGHEHYQEMNGARHHFSDKEVAEREIRKRL